MEEACRLTLLVLAVVLAMVIVSFVVALTVGAVRVVNARYRTLAKRIVANGRNGRKSANGEEEKPK